MATSRVYQVLILYLVLEEVISQALPNLFTPGIVTSTRCVSLSVYSGPQQHGILLVLLVRARSVIFKEALVHLIRSTDTGKKP